MAKTLYDMMDWPEIETIIYSESDDPHVLLGPHKISKGLLVQTFLPDVKKVTLKLKENAKKYPMELMEEPGFYAVLLPKKSKPEYTLLVETISGEQKEMEDPYRFEPVWELTDTQKFNCGIHYQVYDKMGAIPMTMDGVDGVLFSVWAPNAVRVSVIGTFNQWDGRVHQMRRLWDSGVFELFIPGATIGDEYKYELKLRGNEISIKTDPYAYAINREENANSIITEINNYAWNDTSWMKRRQSDTDLDRPLSIYQLHLNTFSDKDIEGKYHTYREMAPAVAQYVKKQGYTHIMLMPVAEYLADDTLGYHTFGYYAPTSRFGYPEDFQYFVDYMHKEEIGVIMEWTPNFFDINDTGLHAFDGTFLYEHMDERQGFHKKEGAGIFNYARPEVKNFLIANAMFWMDKYHMDGIMVHKADSVLYLDYDKNLGEWLPNMYGGNENLDGIEFFKHMNSIVKRVYPGVLLIADDKSGWKNVTQPVDEDALGFDLKLNNGWAEDVLPYMYLEPYFRGGSYYDMLMSMVYAYTEKFVLPISQEYVRSALGSLYKKMPGNNIGKLGNLKTLYGYMMTHPGKKMMFMGQDYAQPASWDGVRAMDGGVLYTSPHKEMAEYISVWNQFYKEHPALYSQDFSEEGFEWINQISAEENIIAFVRKSADKNETLLVVCNFVPAQWDNYKIGVPYAGKYKEVLNSDAVAFGGNGYVNPRVKQAKEDECDGRAYSIRIKIAPLSVSVFQYNGDAGESVANKTDACKSLKATINEKMKEAEQIGDIEKQMKAAKVVAENRAKNRR